MEFKEIEGKELMRVVHMEQLVDVLLMPSIKVSDPKLLETMFLTLPYYSKAHVLLEKLSKKYLFLLEDEESKWKGKWRNNLLNTIVQWINHPRWLHPSHLTSKFLKVWKTMYKEAKKVGKFQEKVFQRKSNNQRIFIF